MNYYSKKIDSPVGKLKLIANDRALVSVLWENDSPDRVKISSGLANENHSILKQAESELNKFFSKDLKSFSVPLEPIGTNFQLEVWSALQRIPFGETYTYGELAKMIGRPKAARALGSANGKNPLSIVIPCHRVIGASGKLTGFAGGLSVKSFLLDLEK